MLIKLGATYFLQTLKTALQGKLLLPATLEPLKYCLYLSLVYYSCTLYFLRSFIINGSLGKSNKAVQKQEINLS